MKGVKIPVAFGEYIVPPVSLRTHFDCESELTVIGDTTAAPKEWTKAACKFMLAVLKRNYPDLTEEQFYETASAADLGALIIAAKNQSGYTARPLVPGSDGSDSPGPTSSDTSSTQPDGSLTTS